MSTDTAWRYTDETVNLLAPLAPTLADAMNAAGDRRRLLLDGTLVSAWRCAGLATDANPDPMYSAKHRDHGLNVQGLATEEGELVYLGAARPGATHDLTAARLDGIVEAAVEAGVETTADSGYQGADGTVRTPIKRPASKSHNGWERMANSALAKVRCAVERPLAALKQWRVLNRLRISPNRATDALHALSSSPGSDLHSPERRSETLTGPGSCR